MTYGEHYSVMGREILEFMHEHLNDPTLYVDGTFGGGGHMGMVLQAFPSIKGLGLDLDTQALANAKNKLGQEIQASRLELVHSNFKDGPGFMKANARPSADAVLLDLGVSSHQFDSAERGMSLRFDGPLDMRMDQSSEDTKTAAVLINTLAEGELTDIFKTYGEERFAARIAQAIVEKRSVAKITRTKELEDIVFHCYPKKQRFGKTHPATRVFQALRIAVNQELTGLDRALEGFYDVLSPGGLLMVISFHSLEDRIVKTTFKRLVELHPDACTILTKRPLVAGEEELDQNRRSRSAKLRVLKKSPPPKRKHYV